MNRRAFLRSLFLAPAAIALTRVLPASMALPWPTVLPREAIPRGILTLHGTFDAAEVARFKAQWTACMRGSRRLGIPLLLSPDDVRALL